MSWVLLSMGAALLWAFSNVLDKVFLTKWIKKPAIPLLVTGSVGLLFSGVIFLKFGYNPLSLFHIGLAIFSGMLLFGASFLYFKAVKLGEVSRIVPLFHIAPLMILVLAGFSLKEIFSPAKYLGIGFLVVGAFLISSKKFKVGKGTGTMIFSVFVFAISATITKYLLGFSNFWTIFSYLRIGGGLILIPTFIFYFKDLKETVKNYGKKVLGVMVASALISSVAKLFFTWGSKLGPITLVDALSSVQSLFLLIFMVILSKFFPKVIKEPISPRILFSKSFAILLLIVGAFLISG